MSLTRSVTVFCDFVVDEVNGTVCGQWEAEGVHTGREARAEARRLGWTYRNGQDFCPRHNPNRQTPGEAPSAQKPPRNP